MSELPFIGYPGLVWAACWQSISWLNNLLAVTTTVADIDDPSRTVFETVRNGIMALDAWQTGLMLTAETDYLSDVQAVPLSLDATTRIYFEARIAAVTAATAGITALPPPIDLLVVPSLQKGKPAIADPGFIEWCMTFNDELPVLITITAADEAQAWLNVANAVAVAQGADLTSAYDTAARMYRCSALVAADLAAIGYPISVTYTGVPLYDSDGNIMYDSDGNIIYSSIDYVPSEVWNQAVTLPTLLLDAASLASAPSTLTAQQCGVIRYALLTQLQQLAMLLLSIREHYVSAPTTAELRNTESLADLAARTTGNFEDWVSIAALNSLKPPFPGPTNQTVAQSGKSLFISGAGVQPDPDAQPATYAANVLGIDWDWGPINGIQPTWIGDIPIIVGYLNFARSIGRRIQTPLGALIYHANYGSRIPPEVGAVQTADEAARLLQYGRSAIAADPRTGSILSSSATTQPGFLATFEAVIAPIGPGATPVSINETIGAVP